MIGYEPVAIVGMGCRFASVASLDEFWKLLIEGRCALRDIPPDRFPLERYHHPTPGTRGRIVTRQGGYFEDIRGFDARFFRLSHREASVMDPQQRILLEVAYDALADAGLPLEQVDGTRAGVFIGLFTNDYRERILKHPDFDFDVYSEIGSTRSSTSGRVAYAFNLTGPALAVDAACASSLTAVHLACLSIWSGETPLAIAGGTNLILEPETTVCFSRSKMLSPESRCRFGDASASGFVRSEGVGVVVLKPLRKAIEDHDRIYAVVRATGCNNDARQGGGLYMTPGRDGQMALLRGVYEEHGLPLDRLVYVEAHGTGTRAGDPVECGAIGAVLGAGRPRERPLYVGSVKTNIGHTEGAAGIAAFIKTALTLHHRTIPPSLHLQTPNPDIPWEAGRLAIPTAVRPIDLEGPVLAGVSSFGLSGTNAHAALESWQEPAAEAGAASPEVFILPVSAHLPAALRAQVDRFRALLEDPEGPSLTDLCYTAAVRRSHFDHRAVAIGATRAELCEGLAPFLETTDEAPAASGAKRAVFVFPGQGGQWKGMGRALIELEPTFREALHQLDRVFVSQQGWSVLEALHDEEAAWSQDISRLQPVLFAVQVALAALWRAYGIEPAAVVGHSMGEVAAACVAGVLDLEDAVRVICARSRLLGRIRGQGAMAVVGLDEAGAARAIRGFEAKVAIAVSNARTSSVLSGDPAALEEILAALSASGIDCRKVDVDVASHSPQTEPLLEDLRRETAACRPLPGQVPVYSTVDAAVRSGEAFDPDYWAANMRNPVRFAEATRALLRDGHDLFIEVGPHPVLLNPLLQTVREEKASAIAVGSMRRDEQSRRSLFNALGAIYLAGGEVRWSGVQPKGRCISLPPYPFQHEPFWFCESNGEASLESTATRRTKEGGRSHPLLPRFFRLGSTRDTSIWEVPLSTRRFPWLADHRVRGGAILPGAAYVEIALAAATEAFAGRPFVLEEIELRDYLAVPPSRDRSLQVMLEPVDAESALLRFYSFEEHDGQPSRLHAVAKVRFADGAPDGAGGVEDHEAAVPEIPALMLEQIGLELARRRHNSRHQFALLGVFVGPADGEERTGLSAGRLARRLRQLLRRGDLVQAVGPGRFVVLLRQVSGIDQLRPVVRRILRRLLEAGDPAGRPARRPLMVVGAVAPAEVDATGLLQAAMNGSMPVLSGLEAEGEEAAPPLEHLSAARFYEGMEARSIGYGPTFRPVRSIERSGRGSRVFLELPDALAGEAGDYLIHPALLDGCFQAAVAAFLGTAEGAGPEDTFLPVGIRQLTLHRRPSGRLFCRAWLRERDEGRPDELELDFTITDGDRQPCLEVEGLRLRLFERRSQLPIDRPFDDWMYRWRWQPAESPAEASAVQGGWWLLLGDHQEALEALQAGLESVGERCVRASEAPLFISPRERGEGGGVPLPSPLTPPGVGGVPLPSLSNSSRVGDGPMSLSDCAGVVFLHRPAQPDPLDGASMLEACIDRCASLMEAVNQLRGQSRPGPLRVWSVTSGGWAVTGRDHGLSLDHAPLWGLGRVMANEMPEVELRQVDLDPEGLEASLPALLRWLRAPDAEDELALRDGRTFVHRLVQTPPSPLEQASTPRRAEVDQPFVVALRRLEEGGLPVLRAAGRVAPGPGEVEIRVHAAVISMPGSPDGAGLEPGCAGTVMAVGEGVDLAPGTRVVAFIPRGPDRLVGRYEVVPRVLVAPMPEELDFARAALLPAVFAPAWLALNRAGPLSPQDRVLVRDAAGPIGLAAAMLAHADGARVFAAAAPLEARVQLRGLGLPCVLDELSEDLAGELMDLTDREGVDLVIETVAGRARQAVASLAAGGRVVDLSSGSERHLDLEGAARSITWCSLDIDELMERRPQVVGAALRAMASRATYGRLPRMPAPPSIPVDRLVDHVSAEEPDRSPLCVVDLEVGSVVLEMPLTRETLFEREASYLITGGTGGLGLEVARWMAATGAGHLVLLSRGTGAPADLDAALEPIRAAGATVHVVRGDVADAASLEPVFAWIDATLPPLRGVFHLAGVLDDATLERQDRAKLERAMAPKVKGAWNLHRLTRHRSLTHFVLFSSAATTLGSPGQANYAAANAFLDALAQHRRKLDLPAVSLNWGTWSETGLAAVRDDRAGRLESRGLAGMSNEDALGALEQALLHVSDPGVALFDMDWARWAKAFPRFTRAPRVAHLVPKVEEAAGEGGTVDLPARIKEATPDERLPLIQEYVRRQVADVMRMPASRLSLSTPLPQLGMDSLMTVELHGRLADALKVEVSPTRILRMAHLGALAEAVIEALTPKEGAAAEAESGALAVVHLDPEILAGSLAKPVSHPGAVLLTGATGFLGAHLLRELLDRTGATVHCLVRGSSREEGLHRIREAMVGYELWSAEDEARIVAVPGDLEAPRLGLSKEVFRAVADRVEAIYHVGAWVNHLYPYERLEAANVHGTREVLRLACIARPLAVHHVSTLAVFPYTTDPESDRTVSEETPLMDQAEPFFAGYGQSKWMAERLIERARERGLNVNVYRAGAITGSTHAGICPSTDLVWRVVQAAVELGMAPTASRGIGLTPVDFVARAMLELSRRPDSVNEVFHLFDPRPFPIQAVIDALRDLGYPLRDTTFEGWQARLQAGVDRSSALFPILPRLRAIDFQRLDAMRIVSDCRKTMERLDRRTIAALRVTPRVMRRYLERMIRDGVLPAPGERMGDGEEGMEAAL